MNKKTKIIIAAASVFLILTFFFPIWQIDLQAPQYPEGIGLNIWINQISGQKPNDINTLNELNHYIGMRKILPDSIEELKVMPYILIFMILFGFIAAVSGKKILVKIWIGIFLMLAVVGMIDFYMWEYSYGHNLNPEAPIKVPGMTYQPPLLGSKQLLNIDAISLPYIGAVIIFISVFTAWFALYKENHLKAKVGK